MSKRTLKDWMGQAWRIELVDLNDSRLPDAAHACIREAKREILVARSHDVSSMIFCMLHEVAHRALTHLDFNDSEKEELVVDNVALSMKTFLEKMGVDLTALVK